MEFKQGLELIEKLELMEKEEKLKIAEYILSNIMPNELIIKGNFSVINRNGEKTMNIDSYGNINIDLKSL